MTTDPIKALVEAAQEFVRKVEAGEAKSTRSYNQFKAALATLKPMADVVMVPREPTEEICNKLRAVLPELFDTSDDTLREIYIDMFAAASPSASTGKDGRVERVARAICRENCAFVGEKPCFEVEGAWPNPNCQEPGCHAQATAALAAIGER